eukprot:4309143-Pyramimonas_sp.AAC.1
MSSSTRGEMAASASCRIVREAGATSFAAASKSASRDTHACTPDGAPATRLVLCAALCLCHALAVGSLTV